MSLSDDEEDEEEEEESSPPRLPPSDAAGRESRGSSGILAKLNSKTS